MALPAALLAARPDVLAFTALAGAVVALVLMRLLSGYKRHSRLVSMPGPKAPLQLERAKGGPDLSSPEAHKQIAKWTEQYGGVMRVVVAGRKAPLVLVSDPAAAHQLLAYGDADTPKCTSHYASIAQVRRLSGGWASQQPPNRR